MATQQSPEVVTYGLQFSPLVLTKDDSDLWKHKAVMAVMTKREMDPEFCANWTKLAEHLPTTKAGYMENSNLKNGVREGVPSYHRSKVWAALTRLKGETEVTQQYAIAIRQTFKWKNPPNFRPRHIPHFGCDTSFDVCQRFCLNEEGKKAYTMIMCMLAEYHPDVTFSPMLSCLVATFLTQLPAPQTFAAVSEVVQASRVKGLKGEGKTIYYVKLAKGPYYNALVAMQTLLQSKFPAVLSSFTTLNVDILQVLYGLFANIFSDVFPLIFVIRIVDTLLNEGFKVFFRYGLALFQHLKPLIAECSAADQLTKLFHDPSMWKADALLSIFTEAFKFSLSRAELETLENKVNSENCDDFFPVPSPTLRSRPVVDGSSDILKTPESWESIFFWIQESSTLMGQLSLIFQTQQHGWSLQSLYRRCNEVQRQFDSCLLLLDANVVINEFAPTVPDPLEGADDIDLLDGEKKEEAPTTTTQQKKTKVSTGKRVTIGVYLSDLPDDEPHTTYFGSRSTFIFQLHPEEKCWGFSGENDYFILPESQYLTIGGGVTGFALRISDDLQTAYSGCCETFGSPALTGCDPNKDDVSLEVLQLEVFGAELLHKFASPSTTRPR